MRNPNVLHRASSTTPHGDYEVKLLSAFAAGNPPDIINLLDYLFPKYVAKGLLAPVEPTAFGVRSLDELRALYEPRALDGLTVGGKVYGVPEEFNTLALFLNQLHFANSGLDAKEFASRTRTWEELFAIAKKVERRDASGSLTRIGFNWVWNLDPYWYAQQYWPILVQYGCEVLAPDGSRSTINSPQCVAAFTETWYRLIAEGTGGPAVATVNPVNALQDFSDGRQAMMIAGIWAPPAFAYNKQVYDNYVVAPLPQKNPREPHTLLNAYALTVSAKCKYPEEAWKFINFLTSQSDGYLQATGYITGRKGWSESLVARQIKGVKVFAEGQRYGSFVWRSPTWTEEGTAIKVAIEKFATGAATVKEALDEAAREIDRIRQQQ
ncbi:MAG: sugar ABC transporter substrate-binding protein [Limnochordaceae bacterium]|nr:sugar ABC transporter substrate-binding protein [Limnochordaceae bacterium]